LRCEWPAARATFVWRNALAGCETLDWGGHTDWRLPDKKELRSIVDNHAYNPSIDTAAFPATPSSWFWSSSSYADNVSLAWDVYFKQRQRGQLRQEQCVLCSLRSRRAVIGALAI